MDYIFKVDEELKIILDSLIDPHTNKIMKNPVLDQENNVVEASLLHTKYKGAYYEAEPIVTLKDFISELVNCNESIKKMQYSEHINLFYLNKIEILRAIENGKFEKILQYSGYKLTKMGDKIIELIVSNCPIDIFKYFVDNCNDINAAIIENAAFNNRNNWSLVHYVCKLGTLEMLEYVLAKDIDISTPTSMSVYMLYLVLGSDRSFDKINLLVSKGVSLLFQCNGQDFFELLCSNEYVNTISSVLDLSVELNINVVNKLKIIKYSKCLQFNNNISKNDKLLLETRIKTLFI